MNRKFHKTKLFFLDLPKTEKLILSILIDCFLCITTVWISFYLRIGYFPLGKVLILPSIAAVIFAIPVFYFSGLYRTIFRYSGWPALLTVSKSIFIYAFLFSFLITFISFKDIPRTIGLIQPILLFLAVGSSRAFVGYWIGDLYKNRIKESKLPKAIIYGAGYAGRNLSIALEDNNSFKVVGFIDDDPSKNGRVLRGKPIYLAKKLDFLVNKKNIKYLFLALPKMKSSKRTKIINKVSKYNLLIRTLPNLSELAKGEIVKSDLIELEIDDLLGREKVEPDKVLMQKNIKSKVVLVTGAGGSIGSELCRQILNIKPKKLLLLDANEFSLYSILNELETLQNDENLEIIPILTSIQNKKKISILLNTWKPDTIYHAAAYKHVPIVEQNLAEGLKNNVFGTLVFAEASIKSKVSNFVFISTDKAVRPTSVMGASKRLGEMILQALYEKQSSKEITKFSMVRFGNVLDSSGSVIPKFRKQIKDRVPITLTHPDISRYFMTIKEAAELVIQASAMSDGGDVFVLDMGDSVKIIDLAKKMINLSGLKLKEGNNREGDISIEITGLRPGEKLYEELLIGNNSELTIHPKIFRAREDFLKWEILNPELVNLEKFISDNDSKKIIEIMEKLVSGYKPSAIIQDLFSRDKIEK
tara:strand:+ start:1750 stop:3678 length:1929 start_codon:yes stop_codon:yes gene_type:complete